MLIQLQRMKVGTRFRVPETGQEGILLKVNACRAYVRILGAPVKTEFETRDGKLVEFTKPGGGYENWTPSLEVEVLP